MSQNQHGSSGQKPPSNERAAELMSELFDDEDLPTIAVQQAYDGAAPTQPLGHDEESVLLTPESLGEIGKNDPTPANPAGEPPAPAAAQTKAPPPTFVLDGEHPGMDNLAEALADGGRGAAAAQPAATHPAAAHPAAPPTPSRNPTSAPLPAASPPKKKSRVGLIIGILVVLLVVAAGTSVGLFFFWQNYDLGEAAPAPPPPSVATTTPAVSAAENAPPPMPTPATPPSLGANLAPPTPTTAAANALSESPAATPPAVDAGTTAATADNAETPTEEPPVNEEETEDSPEAPAVDPPEPEADEAASASSGGGLEGRLAAISDQVGECRHRERGYNPTRLTLHLGADEDGTIRLRNITPPTPPRVARCIAAILDEMPWSTPADGGDVARHTYRF